MTKKELIAEHHKLGNFWASDAYSKEYLEQGLAEEKKARSMTNEELFAMLVSNGRMPK